MAACVSCADSARVSASAGRPVSRSARRFNSPHHSDEFGFLTHEIYPLETSGSGSTDTEIDELNKNFALVIIGDNTVILKTADNNIGFLKVSAFEQWHANRHVNFGDKKIPLGKFWLTHPRRRQYQGLVFSPSGDVPGHFNLWRGFSVEPKPGDCSKFLAHIRDNVCRGDQELFNWVVGWFAQIVQRPAKKMGTSLAIRGKQGTGKPKLVKCSGRCWVRTMRRYPTHAISLDASIPIWCHVCCYIPTKPFGLVIILRKENSRTWLLA
jgi:hypothetical protein